MRPAGPPGGSRRRGHDDAVAAAMRAVDRRAFLPRAQRRWAGQDRPLAIGHGQTNSQPRTVEDMLRLLDVQPGHGVLDVGAGSGWTTALLAQLTGDTGSVRGVELEAELAVWGADNLRHAKMPWASLEPSIPGVLGLPDHAPYDRILVSAEADELPGELVDQLATDGRMVIPVAGRMVLVVRHGDDADVTEHGWYRFVPLRRE